uniref:Uncharacterized protein n=1 Tax=Vespula pensylvanica TaxID=30213 RepID=A0A834N192_VESPE|nr:hypothetical protein H0235_017119 [Vespula pensylvanica]
MPEGISQDGSRRDTARSKGEYVLKVDIDDRILWEPASRFDHRGFLCRRVDDDDRWVESAFSHRSLSQGSSEAFTVSTTRRLVDQTSDRILWERSLEEDEN